MLLRCRAMASTANIVFSPYNYLLDGKIRGGLSSIKWADAVLVFDEAHNLEVPVCATTLPGLDPCPHTAPCMHPVAADAGPVLSALLPFLRKSPGRAADACARRQQRRATAHVTELCDRIACMHAGACMSE